MLVEKVHEGIRYTLSNENLQVNDKVFPIARGRCLEGGGWILHNFDFRDYMSGFPYEPHTILDLHHSDDKSHEIRTDHGYGPAETYYKVVKVEKQIVKNPDVMFKCHEWVEQPLTHIFSESQ
jgi:hypothetical protein